MEQSDFEKSISKSKNLKYKTQTIPEGTKFLRNFEILKKRNEKKILRNCLKKKKREKGEEKKYRLIIACKFHLPQRSHENIVVKRAQHEGK